MKPVGYSKNVFEIPLPDSSKTWEVSGTEMYGVDGVVNESFSCLNKTFVKRLPKGLEAKRRSINKATRDFLRDSDGNYVYESYVVPNGSVVVLSETKISLSYDKYLRAIDGYGYIDFTVTKKGIEYMYVLPKSVLYKINQTALVLSVKDMKNYNGMGYNSWESGKVFLHIIPYNPNSSYTGSKILKTGVTLNYSKEVEEIVNFWQKSVNFIPNILLCQLEDGSNFVLQPTTVGYNEYNPIELISLGEKELYGVSANEK